MASTAATARRGIRHQRRPRVIPRSTQSTRNELPARHPLPSSDPACRRTATQRDRSAGIAYAIHTDGHKPPFTARSKILSRSACEWQVSGAGSEPHSGSIRPQAGIGGRRLLSKPVIRREGAGRCALSRSIRRWTELPRLRGQVFPLRPDVATNRARLQSGAQSLRLQ